MTINQEGLQIIKDSEGLYLKAYHSLEGGADTIGYGHKLKLNDDFREITKDKAEELLKKDVAWAEGAVTSFIKVPLSENKFSALVSLCFNMGINGFRKTDVVKSINEECPNKTIEEAWLKIHHGGGKDLPGLKIRRAREFRLFTKI